MKPLIAIFLTVFSTFSAHALEANAAGTYAIVHRDGHVTDKVFRVSSSAGRWRLEDKKPDGTWSDVTCQQNCELREASSDDMKKIFTETELREISPSCVLNMAFAFCSYNPKSSPTTGYVLIALVTKKPTPIKLTRVTGNA